jgi:competence protein ComEC
MFNPSAYPLVRFCLALMLGILLQDIVCPDFNPTWLFYSMLPLSALASIIVHPRLETVWASGVVILVTLVVLGMQITWLNNELHSRPDHFAHRPDLHLYSGFVSDLPEQTASGGWKYRLRVEHGLDSTNRPFPLVGNLQIYLRPDSSFVPPKYGDRLLLRCSPQRIKGPMNPEAFDFAAYMRTQHVYFQAFVRTDSVVFIEADQGSLFWKYTYAARSHVLQTLARHFTDTADLGVAEALLVGYKGHLPDELQNAYIETGSMHILAVSGAHVGIIFLGLVAIFKRVQIRHRYWRLFETVLIMLCIWAFAFLAGMGPSIARATVMFSFFLFARAFRLDYDGYNILAASAFALLLYDPQMLFQVSFQLSFLAVLGMMLFYPMLYKLSPIMPKWLDYFWQIFLLGIAAQLGTLPISLLYFGQFPTWFWLSGLIVVPVASIYMYAAAALLLVEAIAPLFANWLAIPIVWMVKSMNYLIYGMQKLPAALIDGIWLRWWEVCMLCVLVLLLAIHLHRPKGRWIVAMSGVVCLLSISHLGKTWARNYQREIVFYHTGSERHLLADLILGHQRVSFSEQEFTEKQERFAAHQHRKATGTYGENTTHANWMATKGPFMQIGKTTLAVLTEQFEYQPNGSKVKVETLVVDGAGANDALKALQVFEPKQIVLGQTLSQKAAKHWTNAATDLGIPVHVIAEQGAWIWSL